MQVAIYTANFGNYDSPKKWEIQTTPSSTLSFNEKDIGRYPTAGLHPRIQAKFFKLQPHRIHELKGFDYAIWVDASAFILHQDFVKFMIDSLGDAPMMCFKHPENRDCIYQEAEYCKDMPKYRDQKVLEQVNAYRLDGFPEHNGLFACGMIVYNLSTLPTQLLNMWWEHNLTYTYQDQLSLPYVAWKTGTKVKALELDQYNNPYIAFSRNHNSIL